MTFASRMGTFASNLSRTSVEKQVLAVSDSKSKSKLRSVLVDASPVALKRTVNPLSIGASIKWPNKMHLRSGRIHKGPRFSIPRKMQFEAIFSEGSELTWAGRIAGLSCRCKRTPKSAFPSRPACHTGPTRPGPNKFALMSEQPRETMINKAYIKGRRNTRSVARVIGGEAKEPHA